MSSVLVYLEDYYRYCVGRRTRKEVGDVMRRPEPQSIPKGSSGQGEMEATLSMLKAQGRATWVIKEEVTVGSQEKGYLRVELPAQLCRLAHTLEHCF